MGEGRESRTTRWAVHPVYMAAGPFGTLGNRQSAQAHGQRVRHEMHDCRHAVLRYRHACKSGALNP